MTAARDPYKYFRIEARELLDGLCDGVLRLEKGAIAKDHVPGLLRLAHTLKGASRVVRLGEVAERAHAAEGLLEPLRGAHEPPPRETIDALLKLLDEIRARIAALDAAPGRGDGKDAPAPAEARDAPLETVRVEIEEMNVLFDGVAEASVQVNALRLQGDEIDRLQRIAAALAEPLGARAGGPAETRALAAELRESLRRLRQDVAGRLSQLDAELAQVQGSANRLRLLPASSVFASLERAARDAALSVKKEIDFRATGGDTRLDAHVLDALRDALLHVVRNAVAHGVEPGPERASSGKPSAGRIDLTVERRGNLAAFTCRDDGRGIDVAALAQAAARKGLTPPRAAGLTKQEAFRLLLEGGLTTTQTVTEVSGRGVGLDVVREVVARLKGEVSVRSEPGRGTAFEIVVPVSLTSIQALVVEAGDVVASVPLDAVRATLRLADAEIARSSGRQSVVHEGAVVPFVPLASALGRPNGAARRRKAPWSAVVLQAGEEQVVLGVERLRGTATAVVRPLPPWAEIDATIAGASLDAEGNPQVVLDPRGLAAAARAAHDAAGDDAPARAPVLVVDDSLTTRMLEQSILEAAGYEVELATSAEEALVKARTRRYALFMVDVEMPGMDGFQFVARTRADPALRDVPAILVTSRGSPDDRRRGEEAGARAYVVKGEFDQALLLRTIRGLVG